MKALLPRRAWVPCTRGHTWAWPGMALTDNAWSPRCRGSAEQSAGVGLRGFLALDSSTRALLLNQERF